MKTQKFVLCAVLALMLALNTAAPAFAADNSAKAAVVIEQSSGRVLYAKNPDWELPMASTTKIMTGYLTSKYGTLSDVVEVSENASGVEGSGMYLEKGEHITMENLLYGLMLQSGNDAAVAIAEAIGGSVDRFVEMMNETAANDMGLTHTHFDNPNGLPSDTHYTTAHELAIITAEALKDPTFAQVCATKEKSVPWEGKDYNREMVNHNKLLGVLDGCVGVKTGYTNAAGRCLVTAVTRDGMTLICVTLNDQDDWNDHTNLQNEMFEKYHIEDLTSTETVVDKITVGKGIFGYTGIVPDKTYTFPVCDEDKIEIKTEVSDDVKLPVHAGDAVGSGSVTVNGENYGNFNLIATDDIDLVKPSKDTFLDDIKHDIGTVFKRWSERIKSSVGTSE